MSGYLITAFVVLWLISAINSVRKAVAKAQAEAGGPGAIQSAIADAAAQSESAARTAAAQRAARVLRLRMQAAVSGSGATQGPVAKTAVQSNPMPAYIAPPADQPMTSLTAMEAPRMPTFDAPGLDAGSAIYSFGALGATVGSASAASSAGRQFLLTEGANGGAVAIIAAAVIGPPVGLRPGNLSASDW